ncbi:MAG: hypothetical protein GXO27_01580 [Chlorobi bacterium]|nr:hypothetical protein [Chlorobiota bacterium]
MNIRRLFAAAAVAALVFAAQCSTKKKAAEAEKQPVTERTESNASQGVTEEESARTKAPEENAQPAGTPYSPEYADKLIERYCSACHTLEPARGNHEGLKAPPFPGIVMHYRERYPSYEAFESALVNYVRQPDSSKAVMRGAIAEFGQMPPMPLPEDTLRYIARRLYERFGHMQRGRGHGRGRGMGRGMGRGRMH